MTGTTKGERTRSRILATATALFAEQSYERVSVRRIAAEAEVDPALINHYFGSKDGLFTAVLASAIPAAAVGRVIAVKPRAEWGRELVLTAEQIWTSPLRPALLAMVRAGLAGHPDLLRSFVERAILGEIISHLDGPEDERRRRAGLVGTQMVGLLVARHVIEIGPVAQMTAEELADAVGPTIERYLSGPLDGVRLPGPRD